VKYNVSTFDCLHEEEVMVFGEKLRVRPTATAPTLNKDDHNVSNVNTHWGLKLEATHLERASALPC
jgi:hypothetical protein